MPLPQTPHGRVKQSLVIVQSITQRTKTLSTFCMIYYALFTSNTDGRMYCFSVCLTASRTGEKVTGELSQD